VLRHQDAERVQSDSCFVSERRSSVTFRSSCSAAPWIRTCLQVESARRASHVRSAKRAFHVRSARRASHVRSAKRASHVPEALQDLFLSYRSKSMSAEPDTRFFVVLRVPRCRDSGSRTVVPIRTSNTQVLHFNTLAPMRVTGVSREYKFCTARATGQSQDYIVYWRLKGK
jgi:hypothetical protein